MRFIVLESCCVLVRPGVIPNVNQFELMNHGVCMVADTVANPCANPLVNNCVSSTNLRIALRGGSLIGVYIYICMHTYTVRVYRYTYTCVYGFRMYYYTVLLFQSYDHICMHASLCVCV